MSTEAAPALMPTLALLNACRDLMVHRSNLQMAAAFNRLSDILLDNASKEYDSRVVGSLLEAHAGLQRLRAAINESFAKQLTLRLDGCKSCLVPTAPAQVNDELSLQSDDVLDEYVSAQWLARSIKRAALGQLPVFQQKIASPKRMPALRTEDDPFAPESVISSLLEAMQSVSETTPEMRLHWFRALSSMDGMGYGDVYADLNRYLIDAGVALQKPRAPMRPPSAAPGESGGRAPVGAGLSQPGAAVYSPQTGHPRHPPYPQDAGYAPPGAGGYEQAWATDGGASEHYPSDPYPAANNQHAQTSMQPDTVPLQQLAANLISLVERFQQVVPGISGGPAAADPSLWAMVRNKEAMQISAALGFAANGAFRAPLVAGIDRSLMSSLANLQLRGEQPDFSIPAIVAAPRIMLRKLVPGYL